MAGAAGPWECGFCSFENPGWAAECGACSDERENAVPRGGGGAPRCEPAAKRPRPAAALERPRKLCDIALTAHPGSSQGLQGALAVSVGLLLDDLLPDDRDTLLPLASLVATGRLELRFTESAGGCRAEVYATQLFFEDALLPLSGAATCLPYLINLIRPLHTLGDLTSRPRIWFHRCAAARDDRVLALAQLDEHLAPCSTCHQPGDGGSNLQVRVIELGHHSRAHSPFDAANTLALAKPRPMLYKDPGDATWLTVPLRRYQELAVEWWSRREQDPGEALVPSAELPFADGSGAFHYNDINGDISLAGPCGVHGGILASDMGMGKTVTSLAACSRLGFRAATGPRSERGRVRGGTLILVPAVLVRQWKREIERLLPGAKLLFYYATTSATPCDPEALAEYDIVVTTYTKLCNSVEQQRALWAWGAPDKEPAKLYQGEAVGYLEYLSRALPDTGVSSATSKRVDRQWDELPEAPKGNKSSPLDAVHWHRIVCDEAHVLANHSSPVHRLSATNRWLLSGTPFGTSPSPTAGDICGTLMSLFGVSFCTDYLCLCGTEGLWEHVKRVVARATLRHEKEDMYAGGVVPLLQLPKLEEHLVKVDLTPHEGWVYEYTRNRMTRFLEPFLRRPAWYSSVKYAALRLRQMAAHCRNVQGEPFDVSPRDWRLQLLDGHSAGGWGADVHGRVRLSAKEQRRRARFCSATLEELADVLRRHNCGSDMLSAIVTRNHVEMPDECSICMETMTMGTKKTPCCTTCGHMYCASCVLDFMKDPDLPLNQQAGRNSLCPMCQRRLQDANIYCIWGGRPVEKPPSAAAGGQQAAAAAAAAEDSDDPDENEDEGEKAAPRRSGAAAAAVAADEPTGRVRKRRHEPNVLGDRPKEIDERGWLNLYGKLRTRPWSSKLDAALDVIDSVLTDAKHPQWDPSAKFLIFTQFSATRVLLCKELQARNIGKAVLETGSGTWARAVARFDSDPALQVLLLPLSVGAVGLNLTAANHILIVEPPNNLTLELQAIGRCHRLGQGREVHVWKFVAAGTIDVALAEAAQRRKAERGGSIVTGDAAADDYHDGGRGAGVLARRELLACFGFLEEQAYDPARDG